MRIVILSGGSGTRLWPLSNAVQSKQFLRVLDGPSGEKESMLQRVYRQLEAAGISKGNISIITGSKQADYIRRQVGTETVLIEEPERRNTFPAISLAALHLAECQHAECDEPVVVMPADVYAEQGYFETLKEMAKICESDEAELVLMGIRPERASDQFGYIVPKQSSDSDNRFVTESLEDGPGKKGSCANRVVKVSHFVEKPSVSHAEELIKQGALWNGGVFVFRLSWMLERIRQIAPEVNYERLRSNYDILEKTSFDYAVVEKVSDIAAASYAGQWMDLGTWDTLCAQMADKVSGNVISTHASDGSVIINELEIPMTVLGIKDAVVCATWDGILVSDKCESAHLKEYLNVPDPRPMYEQRRWGEYSVLQNMEVCDGRKSLIKHLKVDAGKNISYQKHHFRDEIWTVISGSGEVTLEGKCFRVKTGDVVRIPAETFHGVKGISDLHIMEVQIGQELSEADIERSKDQN